MIEGVEVIPLKQISDYRGKIMKMLSINDAHYKMFGEIYFSQVHPGMVKAWHSHKSMWLNYACLMGKIQLVLYDVRPRSSTYDELMEIYLSPEEYKLVKIPPNILNGFKGLGTTDSLVANLATIPHTEGEIERFPLDYVEYSWFRKGG